MNTSTLPDSQHRPQQPEHHQRWQCEAESAEEREDHQTHGPDARAAQFDEQPEPLLDHVSELGVVQEHDHQGGGQEREEQRLDQHHHRIRHERQLQQKILPGDLDGGRDLQQRLARISHQEP